MAIPDGAWREVALSDDEWTRISELLGREPTPVELGMFGSMWSEHCGYKHSRPLFRFFRTSAPWVIQGPGENAGAVDIGDGLAAVFKVESHNHPSAVEPYEGAATGVGGIVRDIFTMGARPIAVLDGLRFGHLDVPRNRYLFSNVVAGIGGYGNCLGIPNVGGEVFFDPAFNGNPLVNAMCVGIVPHDKLTRARAEGPGNVLMVAGADTGRDGLGGATFSSVDDPEASHRGVIQVGNPFLERQLIEACLELLETDDIVAMQDMGAAGLTSSLVECTSRGGVGAEIDVQKVPRREEGMTAYEVMLSESQERMLLVVRPEGVERVTGILERWSLHAAVVGQVTDDGLVRVRDGDEVVVEVPAGLFTDECPTYEPEAKEGERPIAARARAVPADSISDPEDLFGRLDQLLGSPNIASRRPVIEQYDHTILTNTVVAPGQGDAAVLRIKGTTRGLAISLDCNSRYCSLDPRLGARHAVAEAARNVSCVGGTPLALTNCLNFGNPRRPAGYYQLSQAVQGIADASAAFTIPVVSGNVSLYNETDQSAVLPTPTIGVVGVLDDVTRHASMNWQTDDVLLLLGAGEPTLGGSEYLAVIEGESWGQPPALDMDAEVALTRFVRQQIAAGELRTAHDVGLGGLLVALTEMAILSGVGFLADAGSIGAGETAWFGESASRILVAVPANASAGLLTAAEAAGIRARPLGMAGGDAITIGDAARSLSDLARTWETGLERALDTTVSATA
ncbi:MAG TPA: phosphoribosylformylglycinamidine synthase subunit PurL [Thermomicrobiales bacterium]|nr:phosphoribosylformylglycinamidine synthase subunit PurL [Thermomicrobiales bacterium]